MSLMRRLRRCRAGLKGSSVRSTTTFMVAIDFLPPPPCPPFCQALIALMLSKSRWRLLLLFLQKSFFETEIILSSVCTQGIQTWSTVSVELMIEIEVTQLDQQTHPPTHTQTFTHVYTHIHVLLVVRSVVSCRLVTFSLHTRNIRLSLRQT